MYLHREGESMYTFYLPEWKGVNPETGLGEFWLDPEDHSKGVVNDYSEAGKGIVGKALPVLSVDSATLSHTKTLTCHS